MIAKLGVRKSQRLVCTLTRSVSGLAMCWHPDVAAAQNAGKPYIRVEPFGGQSYVTNANGVVLQPPRRGTNLVNPDTTQRAVANLEITSSAPALPFFDTHFHQVDLSKRSLSVLLQPGGEILLPSGVSCGTSQLRNSNGTVEYKHCNVNFTYKVIGYYTPRPDLHRLQIGLAADYLRFYISTDHYDSSVIDDPNMCRKHGLSMGFMLFNILLDRNLYVNYSYSRDGKSWTSDSQLVKPGGNSVIWGCARQDLLRVDNVRFADQ